MTDALYGIRKRWTMKPSTYQGDTPIHTIDGLYVCAVPYQVAYSIVRDHNAAVADAAALAAERRAREAAEARERVLQQALDIAEAVAQMAAHDRDEALKNFARVEQEYGELEQQRDRLILAVKEFGGFEHFAQCPVCMAERTNGEWHDDDCPAIGDN